MNGSVIQVMLSSRFHTTIGLARRYLRVCPDFPVPQRTLHLSGSDLPKRNMVCAYPSGEKLLTGVPWRPGPEAEADLFHVGRSNKDDNRRCGDGAGNAVGPLPFGEGIQVVGLIVHPEVAGLSPCPELRTAP